MITVFTHILLYDLYDRTLCLNYCRDILGPARTLYTVPGVERLSRRDVHDVIALSVVGPQLLAVPDGAVHEHAQPATVPAGHHV